MNFQHFAHYLGTVMHPTEQPRTSKTSNEFRPATDCCPRYAWSNGMLFFARDLGFNIEFRRYRVNQWCCSMWNGDNLDFANDCLRRIVLAIEDDHAIFTVLGTAWSQLWNRRSLCWSLNEGHKHVSRLVDEGRLHHTKKKRSNGPR